MALIKYKKIIYKISPHLREYLVKYGREIPLPIGYDDLNRYSSSITLYDREGQDSLWETVFYAPSEIKDVYQNLKVIYAELKTNGDLSVTQHLTVSRVDVCVYGNTRPFRVRVLNTINDNFDYFYIKKADASRVYGLELEHILSPNRISYLTSGNTLVEEHIAGIPGDLFIRHYLQDPHLNRVRLAKEFVKFNERCFVRLLGDMHASNFVIVLTPDFEEVHYRIRAIDFDQQSYEGRRSVFMPQYFKQNNPILELGYNHVTPESVRQYQKEEKVMIANRLNTAGNRIISLTDMMAAEEISTPENTTNLRKELAEYYGDDNFRRCKTMGEIVQVSLRRVLREADHPH
jgi:hypothetical protein